MTRIRWFLLTIGLLLIGIYFLFDGGGKQNADLKSLVTKPTQFSLPQPRIKEIYQGARPPIPVRAQENKIPPGCLNFWNELLAIEMKELFDPPITEKWKLPSEKQCSQPPEFMGQMHANFLENCQALPATVSKQERQKQKTSCYVALFFYRAAITDWQTRKDKLGDISDPKILVDKMMSKFQSDPRAAADIADRLLEVEPGLYPVAKAGLLARMMVASKQKDPNHTSWERVSESLSRIKEMDHKEDRNIIEMEMTLELLRNKDEKNIETRAHKLNSDYPEYGLGPYYLAWIANKRGTRKKAIQLVRAAIDREPHQQNYRQTLAKLLQAQESGEVKEAFQSGFSFSLDMVGQ